VLSFLSSVSESVEFQEETALGKAYDGRLLVRLLGYVVPYRRWVVVAVSLIVVSSFLQLIGPLATAVALDLYIRPFEEQPQVISTVSRWVESELDRRKIEVDPATGLAAVSLIYLATLFLTFFVLYFQSYVMQMMGQRIMVDLRRDIYGRLHEVPMTFIDRNPVGRLVTRVTNDVDALNELFTAGIVSIIGDLILLAGIMGVLFWLNWRLALVSFAILPLLLLLTFWFKIRARQSYRDIRVKLARINAYFQEHITGMSIIQLFNREKRSFDEFSGINDEHRIANIRAIVFYAIYYPGVELITALGIGLILWYGGGQVLGGLLSVGSLVAFLQYAQRFYQPLADLSEKYNILQAAMASSERIFSLLDEPVDIQSPIDAYNPDRVAGAVEFEQVTFAYKAGDTVLEDISFRAAPGETVAIVGHTGAGKSTLTNLLLRFYDVREGSTKLDGVDVRAWDLAALRRSIAIVLQDVFLFSGNVAENIHLGETSIDEDRLRWAAKEVHALDFIEALPAGLDSPIRERGAGLSVGQKQLIAFARALAFDPKVLILDEATSSIDTETEQRIQLALERLLVGRTSLVIAHRLSTIQKADRILVLHKGRLREQGTHQELLAQRGIYFRLYQLQYKDQLSMEESVTG
jgi:ATP-binding cassette subfamily B protein